MNFKNDRKILAEIRNCLRDRQFFSNELGVYDFILSGQWEAFSGPDRKACSEAYVDSMLEGLRAKSNPKNDSLAAELERNRERYAEKFGKNWDRLHQAGFVRKEDIPEGAVAVVFDDKALASWLDEAGYDVVFRTDKPSDSFPHEIARLMEGAGKRLRCWSTNIEGLELGRFNRELREKNVPQLNLKVLPYGFVPSESDEPSLIELTPEQALAFRRLKTHNFVGTGAMEKMLGVCINGYLCGVLSYSTAQAEYYGMDENMLFMQCAVGVNVRDRRYKISKFVDWVGLWDKACKHYLNDLQRETYTVVGSSSISKYPENKSVRYIMEIAHRTFDEKTQLYHILYKCEMKRYDSIKEIYLKWLKSTKK